MNQAFSLTLETVELLLLKIHAQHIWNYQHVAKECTLWVSADGRCMPPFTVYKESSSVWYMDSRWPPRTLYGCINSGWKFSKMNKKLFEIHWTNKKNLCLRWCSSYLTYETIRYSMENQTIILCLSSNTSHNVQRLDVGDFPPLKRKWKGILKLISRKSTSKCDPIYFSFFLR